MNNQHFKEIVETVLCTTGTSKRQLVSTIGVRQATLNAWMLKGVPNRKVPMIMTLLKRYTRRFV